MERTATLRTPVVFADPPIPGQPFDSGIPHCVWHRLLLDADVPSGCSISVAARASDDAGLLDQLAFVDQPAPYRRRAGSELPWHDPWATVQRPSDAAGTWELLFQHVVGCSLDVDVVFATGPCTDNPARIVDRVGHRFRVLIPERLDDDRAAMVARIVAAARPAHATFEIRSYGGLLIVGEGQLGVDTVVGAARRSRRSRSAPRRSPPAPSPPSIRWRSPTV